MSKIPAFFLVKDDGEVEWTDDADVAASASDDGSTVVINVKACEAAFDGDRNSINKADRDDWIEDEDEDAYEEDNE